MSEQTNPHAAKVRIGIQPTGWTNDDFPEIGDDTPYQQIMQETAASGFAGGSTGHNYPSHVPSLRRALAEAGLGITSTWVGTHFTALGRFDQTIDEVNRQIALLKNVGATDIVVAELAAAVNQVRTLSVLTDRPIFNEPQWYLLAKGLDHAGKLALDAGMRLSYHPHVGTGVQQRDDIDRLFAMTDPQYVSMCLDTGHVQYAGVDPVWLAQDYTARIGHIHLKSVRPDVMAQAVAGKYSFYQAILEGIFTVPGDPQGGIDFDPIFELLRRHDYSGWIVVEAEQDPAKANPLTCAKISRDFIRTHFGV